MRNSSMIFSSSPLSQPLESSMRLHRTRPLQLMSPFSQFFGTISCLCFPHYRWVWACQMLYDVRYETGDLPHRVFKFFQLLILGMSHYTTQSDKKRASQHLPDGSTPIMAFLAMWDLNMVQQTHPNVKLATMHSLESRRCTSSVDLSLQDNTHWCTAVLAPNHTLNETISCFKLPRCVSALGCGSAACLWNTVNRVPGALF